MSFEEMAESAKSAGLPTEFKFDESPVRTVIKDGEPWFVAKDVCEILDLEDPSMTVSRLEEDQRGKANVCTPGGQQQMLTVSESGLYSLIFTSRKPEAKRFRKWIASEVLPSIRKTGGYQIPEAALSASRAMRSTTSVGSSSALFSTPRSSPSKCSASASISSSR